MKQTLILTAIFLSLLPPFALAEVADTELNYFLVSPIPGGDTSVKDFPQYVEFIIPFLLSFAAIAALVMFVVGGFQYMTGGMSPAILTNAKERISNAIFGLVIIVFSVTILATINPELVTLKLDLSKVGECVGCNATYTNKRDDLAPPGSLGEDATCFEDSECVDGTRCINDKCTRAGQGIGQSCPSGDGKQCESGVCVTRVCVRSDLEKGEGCQTTPQCKAGMECIQWATSKTCEKANSLDEGAKCPIGSNLCKAGLFCGDSAGFNECYRKYSVADGNTCYGDPHCLAGSACTKNLISSNICFKMNSKSRGQECSGDSRECTGNLICDDVGPGGSYICTLE